MDDQIKTKVLRILDENRIMSLATLRPDGWPQATTVGYANDQLTLYFLCGATSQKATNLARDDRVSLTINADTDQVMEITGLSMAARARPVVTVEKVDKILRMLVAKYPDQQSSLPAPNPADLRIFRIDPFVISVLDYSMGFAHADLVTC